MRFRKGMDVVNFSERFEMSEGEQMKTWQHSLRLVLGCLMLGLGLPTVTSGAVYTW